MAASEVALLKTNFFRIVDTSVAETWVSGKAEYIHAIGEDKTRKLFGLTYSFKVAAHPKCQHFVEKNIL